MNVSRIPLRIAQISDIHCGELTFDAHLLESAIKRINAMRPDVVVIAGDMTASGTNGSSRTRPAGSMRSSPRR